MEKSIITSGKTIDLAIESALSQLGLDRDSVSVTVLQQAKSGFLGFGAQSAKVQVTYEVPDPVPEKEEKPKSALGSASRSKPKAPAAPVKKPEAPQPPKAEPPKPAPQPAPTPAPAKRPEPPKQDKPRAPKAPRPEKPKVPAAPKTYAPAEPGSVEEKIEVFIKGLLEHMDSNAVPHCWKDEGNTYKVALVGDDLGDLIGRRGDTLDAIQHLTNYTINRDVEVDGRTMTLIQTNAALNDGTSGGPLINEYGQVVGLNVVKMSAHEGETGVEGLGFAVPSETVEYLANQILQYGAPLPDTSLGITVYAVGAEGDAVRGLMVRQVTEGSGADLAGIRAGDIILSADGAAVRETADLLARRRQHAPGEDMTLTLLRGGETITVQVTLDAAE